MPRSLSSQTFAEVQQIHSRCDCPNCGAGRCGSATTADRPTNRPEESATARTSLVSGSSGAVTASAANGGSSSLGTLRQTPYERSYRAALCHCYFKHQEHRESTYVNVRDQGATGSLTALSEQP